MAGRPKDPNSAIDCLTQLLSDVFVFRYRAQGYHWNVVGPDFAEYHALFGEIYDDVDGSIDPIAENIRKLRGTAPYKLNFFAQHSEITDTPLPTTSGGMAADLLAANEEVLSCLYDCFDVCTECNQQGIANHLAERIDMHQKWSWQLRSSAAR
jgi:starvation-inducible DNA-binding protein